MQSLKTNKSHESESNLTQFEYWDTREGGQAAAVQVNLHAAFTSKDHKADYAVF